MTTLAEARFLYVRRGEWCGLVIARVKSTLELLMTNDWARLLELHALIGRKD